MGSLEGRKALVTGGASGIGLATTKRFIAEGASVAIIDVNEEAGKKKADEAGAVFVRADASSADDVADAFRQTSTELGGLDIAYMNAGVTIRPPSDRADPGWGFDIASLDEQQYRRIMGINVDGVVYGVREAVRTMTGGGSILCTASIAGITAYPPDPIYALTKHAVVGLVRGLGPTLADKGITINAICPGITDTPLVGAAAKETLTQAGFPLIPPEGIAEACVMAITSGESGNAWVVQPGRQPLAYGFRGVPGPRIEGAEGMAPPGWRLERQ
jgi:NAD(P)-dependent dehydrogenase (short-subunit alcohol dehydrogenase family)